MTPPPDRAEPLSSDEKASLLALSRASLENLFSPEDDSFDRWRAKMPPPRLSAPGACFVTLLSRGDRLRGCIGVLESDEPLGENVHRLTRQAAFEDPRFPPVEAREIASLRIHLTVLGPVVPLPRLQDIEVGKHGLVVEAGRQRGVLLASVAVEYGWNRDQFVAETCEKASLAPELAATYRWSHFTEESFGEPPLL